MTYHEHDHCTLTNDGTYAYTWNAAGRLVKAQSITHTVVYTYNGDGVRRAMAVDGVVTYWTTDIAIGLEQVLIEHTPSGATVYLLGLSRLAEVEGGSVEWFLGDGLGSTRQLVDGDGAVVLAQRYDPYGLLLAQYGTGCSGYGFTGEQVDPTGLVYLRARYYNPKTARFFSKDDWPGEVDQPVTFHAYLYVWNNPLRYTDPSGHWPPPEGEWWRSFVPPVGRAIGGYRFASWAREELVTNPAYRASIHSPSAFRDDATEWLMAQMKQNAGGPIAQALKSNVQGGTCNRVAAYLGWYAMVRGGAPWDFKPDIRRIAWRVIEPNGNPGPPVIKLAGKWYNYDIAANVHYGYVGEASGFPRVDLLAFAGLAQIASNTSDWSYWPTIFDDPADAAGIRVGMKLWEEHGLGFTREDFARVLDEYSSQLPEVFPGTILVQSSSVR